MFVCVSSNFQWHLIKDQETAHLKFQYWWKRQKCQSQFIFANSLLCSTYVTSRLSKELILLFLNKLILYPQTNQTQKLLSTDKHSVSLSTDRIFSCPSGECVWTLQLLIQISFPPWYPPAYPNSIFFYVPYYFVYVSSSALLFLVFICVLLGS